MRRLAIAVLVMCSGALARPAAATAVQAALEGVGEASLRALLTSVSACLDPKRAAPDGIAILSQRAERDRTAMLEALASQGYFAATVTAAVREAPPRVRFTVAPGRLHVYGSVRVVQDGGAALREGASLPGPAELGLAEGAPALSRPVVAARGRLESWLPAHGHPVGSRVAQRVRVSRKAGTMDVTFTVTPGPLVRFGAARFRGLESVDEAALRSDVPWKSGDAYDPAKLLAYQKSLLARGLFATAQVQLGAMPAGAATPAIVPVEVAVRERPHRTVRASATYRTDAGAGAQVAWSHRNADGAGDRLDTELVANELTLNASARFVQKRFRRDDQTLGVDLRVARDTPIAFESDNVAAAVHVERTLTPRTRADVGLGLKLAEVDQNGSSDRFGLVQLPLQLTHDSSDGLLDPRRGQRFALTITPILDPFEGQTNLIVSSLRHRAYRSLGGPRRVLASRVAVGLIAARDRATIPADERFYAGGGNSVRGYPFKSIGVGNGVAVLGGRTLIEGSLELRQQLGANLGVVAFVDAGSVQDAESGIESSFLVGAGVGARYYSAVGPVRLDVAVPLDRRDGIDAAVQVYASLGQAF